MCLCKYCTFTFMHKQPKDHLAYSKKWLITLNPIKIEAVRRQVRPGLGVIIDVIHMCKCFSHPHYFTIMAFPFFPQQVSFVL
ncbi:hypothetical protein DESC_480017 [Desulfosarcina cetonica]|nr:hypothetical protein DESC_480017 [Desulfosarcina cetonica]